ncbi:LysR family transcriptional regulator [Chromobacterium subtsugae]|uniref:LysR family transcriptional regulator n=1 Tax=Chromobacterium subtsugae TaxID=251747 RepID=A0ABS7FCP1_9NEIS|nr:MULTISPECIES: LysR family transcriptional regulator [Chromobacterium]KUM05657.1 LysR family transcriptional regulator [Chromobacterium subtsugae]KZE87176.1 LysR family transcriptional regulator [Chromobacterium sp. F49]MBW7565877.1 LysR family transcriptional regulator [Chromobacterium subtsugae]MBW8287083.1 LysR family transcriptional regulator [Chromobacterium subtsugae]OBU88154.1 LysR family transcriptional regulator [Chromobacterium subtsugae]
MSELKQLETFVAVVGLGSLSAAARQLGVVPAMVGRRLDALEERLGVRLLARSTRRVAPTQEGEAFYEDCQRILADLTEAEAAAASGSGKARGHLRLSAPAGFGRRHVAPHVADFQRLHPEVKVTLDLSDRLVDLQRDRIDCAIRISDLADSGLVAIRLAENRRVVVAAPAYLAEHGVPRAPADLQHHQCLSLGESQSRGWSFAVDGRPVNLKVAGALECNDGAVLHDWALQGLGLAWRSLWEVKEDLSEGRLLTVLDDFASPDYPVCAVVQQRRLLPARVRRFVDHLRAAYAAPGYWD